MSTASTTEHCAMVFSTPIVYETYRSADYGAAFLLPIGHVIDVVPCAPQFDTASRYSPGEMWPCRCATAIVIRHISSDVTRSHFAPSHCADGAFSCSPNGTGSLLTLPHQAGPSGEFAMKTGRHTNKRYVSEPLYPRGGPAGAPPPPSPDRPIFSEPVRSG